ncbi:MAG: FkbM family methyltransferase [Chlamydiales bacterium]|jgi:FkbM family methyltransferase
MDECDFFKRAILTQFYEKMHVMEKNNWDAFRYQNDPDEQKGHFNHNLHTDYLLFFLKHCPEIYETYKSLEDGLSKIWMQDLLLFRLLGHLHVKLLNNNSQFLGAHKKAQAHFVKKSELKFRSYVGGELSLCEVEFCGEKIQVNTWVEAIANIFYHKQYYFSREQEVCAPEVGDYVIDAGACLGDTALAFAASVGPEGKVFSFDIVPTHLAIMKKNFTANPNLSDRLHIIPKGLSNKTVKADKIVSELKDIDPGARFTTAGIIQDLTSIDDFVFNGEKTLPRVDFIKMDIEGAELEALQGAEKTLRIFRPKLAISIYHKNSDFTDIPRFLRNLSLAYRFYIDHHTIYAEETILYANAR